MSPDEPTTPQPPTEGDAPHRLDTIAVRSGRTAHGPSLAPVLWATSTFAQDDLLQSRKMATRPQEANFYSRHGNPTVRGFEEVVAELEGAEAAQGFASGMGAIASTVLALCSAGDHVVAQRQLYAATTKLFQGVLPRFGIDVTFVDAADTEGWKAAVQPGKTVLLFAETPANPLLQLVDLEAIGGIMGPIKVVDSTFAGPFIQRPLEHGVDLVVHSATKSMSGHNDATLGVIAGERDLVQWIWGYHTVHGAVASPFDALNGLRGLRTLGLRIRQQSATAQRLAEFLEHHPAVSAVHYPGLDSHPQRDLAKRQMALGGGILSFDVADEAGNGSAGRRFAEGCRLARLAPSLGGPDTLITHPASTTAAGLAPEDREEVGIGEGLIRMSVGLEHVDDVLADVAQSLAALGG
jgi:cystathionine beta-lyase/cystathionine gamma-synthase